MYAVKLKNKVGAEVTYSGIEQITVPLASGSRNATFLARYSVTRYTSANITYDGGDSAANSVDYMCRISTGTTDKHVPNSIKVKVGGSEATESLAYNYTRLSNTEAIVKINGSYITGDIEIEAVAVVAST